MKDRVEVVRVFREQMEQVGGFLPHHIVEEIGNVMRQERCSEHIVKKTVEQNVEVRCLILKEHVGAVSLASHAQFSRPFHKLSSSLSHVLLLCQVSLVPRGQL